MLCVDSALGRMTWTSRSIECLIHWQCSAGTHWSAKIAEVSHSLSSRQESLFPNTPYRRELNQYSVMSETTNNWIRNTVWSREQKPRWKHPNHQGQTGNKLGVMSRRIAEKLMGSCLKLLSCPLCFLRAAEVTRQIFIVLMSGGNRELRRLIRSCESTSASVPANQGLSSEDTAVNLGVRLLPPTPWLRVSHDRSSHVPPVFSPRKNCLNSGKPWSGF